MLVTHKCPVQGCFEQVSYKFLMCRTHWHMVPLPLRGPVYSTWDHGAGAGGREHARAAQAAIEAVNSQLQESSAVS